MSKNQLPTYSLHNFSHPETQSRQFQLEVFDAKRHFAVEYPHRHDFFEILYLKEGSGFHIIDNNKYEIKPPCIFFMSPGQAHKLELSNDIKGYIFIFTNEFFLLDKANRNKLLEYPFFFTIKQNNPPLFLKDNDLSSFFEILFKQGIKETECNSEYSEEIIKSTLELILSFSAKLYKSDESLKMKTKGHLTVKRFYQLIEENYQNNISVNDYASMLAITPGHLTQIVKQLTGKTTNEIIQEKQILEIKRLLLHTNMGITEISHSLNFSDQSYFTKFFKKHTGETPNQFRTKSMKST